jgi:opacity protein-like surface antigen
MKTFTKILSIAAVALTIGITSANAQSMERTTGVRFGFGLNGSVGEKGAPFEYGVGADARLQLDLSKELSITATGGYTRLMAKDNMGDDYDFIPAKGGVKIFPIGNMYTMGEIGAGFGIKDGSKTSLIFGGGIGFELNSGLDISARYEGYKQDSSSSTYRPQNGQFALRLAYGFKL